MLISCVTLLFKHITVAIKVMKFYKYLIILPVIDSKSKIEEKSVKDSEN